MLQSLYIKNYAIIDEVELNFEEGFNVITGETGAGKSILLGALKLIDGFRADTKVLYDQNAKCIVEATFKVSQLISGKMDDLIDADFEGEIIMIRREISSTGKSRAFINDTPVRLQDIKKASELIIDIHNQFDTMTITDSSYQLAVIDAVAENQDIKEKYRLKYQKYLDLKNDIKKLEQVKKQNTQDLDFIKFQLEELDRIPLDGLIKHEIIAEHATLSNSENIIALVNGMTNEFQESDHAVSDRISTFLKQVSDLSEINPQIAEIKENLEGVLESLREVDTISNRLVENIDVSDARLTELTETIDHLNKLEKKHNVNSVEEILLIRDNYKLRTEGAFNVDDQLNIKKKDLEITSQKLNTIASKLTKSRTKTFPRIVDVLEKSLSNLAITNARFLIENNTQSDYDENGIDEITFNFSANKGIDPQPISNVASGGELSRVALSVKSMIAEQYGVPTLIFDEIDTGISGAVAKRVGEILQHIADNRQVICITHSPQVAALASRHFLIEKRDTETRTITHVKLLDMDGRVAEIGKMLSEDPPSGSAIGNAKELLGILID